MTYYAAKNFVRQVICCPNLARKTASPYTRGAIAMIHDSEWFLNQAKKRRPAQPWRICKASPRKAELTLPSYEHRLTERILVTRLHRTARRRNRATRQNPGASVVRRRPAGVETCRAALAHNNPRVHEPLGSTRGFEQTSEPRPRPRINASGFGERSSGSKTDQKTSASCAKRLGFSTLAARGETQLLLFDGIAAPVIYAQAGQVSAVVPYSVNRPSAT